MKQEQQIKNKVEIKEFLGMDVRVVNDEYIVLKDMFNVLGRVKEDGTWTNEKIKLMKFLEDINKKVDHQILRVDLNKKKGKGNKSNGSIQDLDCLKLSTVPMALTQFKPSTLKSRTEEQNKTLLNKWRDLMKFINNLLEELEVYKFIITDKELQKDEIERLLDSDGTPVIANKQVNMIMAKLLGVYPEIKSIKKDELKIYQPQTTVDLLTVRQYVLNKFVNAYEFSGSHKESGELAYKLALKKYNL